MAIGDYILCCKCEVKLIYDGDRNQREWWEERFGKEPEIECPNCKPQRTEPVIDKSAAIRIATVLGWTPPRTWVGLTDEEIEQGCKESWVTLQAWQSGVWWAEARLKQKNGYTEEKNT